MSAVPRIDMSLDDIIKLNRQKIKQEKRFQPKQENDIQSASVKREIQNTSTTAANATRGRGAVRGGRRGRGRGGGQVAHDQGPRNPKYRVPNKLRKFATQNTRVTGARGRGNQRRKQITKIGQQSANKARQTLRQSLQDKQRERKQQILNRYRGIDQPNAVNSSRAASNTTASGRRKLVRPGFGVMHSDIVDLQNQQKQEVNAFKYSNEAAVTGQRKENIKRRWKRQQKNAEPVVQVNAYKYASEAAVTGQKKYNVKRRYQRQQTRAQLSGRVAVTQPAGQTSSPVITIKVENDLAESTSNLPRYAASQSVGQRTQTVANRMLKNTLQQPMRERAQVARRQAAKAKAARARGSGVKGQVRMLTNTIQTLRQQVFSLQGGAGSGGVRRRAQARGGRKNRGNVHAARQTNTKGRQSTSHSQFNPTRKVVW